MSHPIAAVWPKSLNQAIRNAQVNSDAVSKEVFVVCPKESCNALYKSTDVAQTCTNVLFGKVCGTSLGYYKNLVRGKRKWIPYKTFQFIPPSSTLTKMFSSSKFNALLDRKREMMPASDVIQDVMDGRVWKKFEESNFFTDKYHIGLMMSVDWFRPFKRSEYKVAAILLTVLNLPREERMKKKWTILAGKTWYSYYNYVYSYYYALLRHYSWSSRAISEHQHFPSAAR